MITSENNDETFISSLCQDDVKRCTRADSGDPYRRSRPDVLTLEPEGSVAGSAASNPGRKAGSQRHLGFLERRPPGAAEGAQWKTSVNSGGSCGFRTAVGRNSPVKRFDIRDCSGRVAYRVRAGDLVRARKQAPRQSNVTDCRSDGW